MTKMILTIGHLTCVDHLRPMSGAILESIEWAILSSEKSPLLLGIQGSGGTARADTSSLSKRIATAVSGERKMQQNSVAADGAFDNTWPCLNIGLG
jgi:hypothetical protein